ncbi:MAG: PAS domain-containing sensor histidine kinase [Gammaproteobacteria bacterium]
MAATPDTLHLEQAFSAFTQHAQQLENAFGGLRERVTVLNEELAVANSERLEQLRAKEALATRLERLLGALPGGVIVTDPDGHITECNQSAVDMLGGSPMGKTAEEAVGAVTRSAHDGELTLANGRRVSVSRKALGTGGDAIVLLTDVTETRTIQSMLARKQRLVEMGEMAARLAHQVRTPLSSALLYSSQLGRARVDDTKRRSYAQRITARLGQLERMVNDMLGFARGSTMANEVIPVHEMLRDVLQLIETERRDEDRTSIVIEHGLEAVTGNRDALVGAMTNLCCNALQASDAGVCLTLTARRLESGEIALGVRDTGPGLSPGDRARMFDAFFTTRTGGTGLGLAVVKSTAEAHGGDVSVESQPGEGCLIEMHIEDPQQSQTLGGAENSVDRTAATCA